MRCGRDSLLLKGCWVRQLGSWMDPEPRALADLGAGAGAGCLGELAAGAQHRGHGYLAHVEAGLPHISLGGPAQREPVAARGGR